MFEPYSDECEVLPTSSTSSAGSGPNILNHAGRVDDSVGWVGSEKSDPRPTLLCGFGAYGSISSQ